MNEVTSAPAGPTIAAGERQAENDYPWRDLSLNGPSQRLARITVPVQSCRRRRSAMPAIGARPGSNALPIDTEGACEVSLF